jgi:hypothetical protein
VIDPPLNLPPTRRYCARLPTLYLALCVFSASALAAPGITARYDPDEPNRQSAIF